MNLIAVKAHGLNTTKAKLYPNYQYLEEFSPKSIDTLYRLHGEQMTLKKYAIECAAAFCDEEIYSINEKEIMFMNGEEEALESHMHLTDAECHIYCGDYNLSVFDLDALKVSKYRGDQANYKKLTKLINSVTYK